MLRPEPAKDTSVARPDTTFLVTNMLRSVINEGTGAAARAMGFTPDAAGKSGTTNDQRDAWFVGFTPELLTVVWVGFDDNTPIGLTGSQVALPIWTEFMKVAVAGRAGSQFAAARGDQLRGNRPRHRQARHTQLPAHVHRVVYHRDRAARNLSTALTCAKISYLARARWSARHFGSDGRPRRARRGVISGCRRNARTLLARSGRLRETPDCPA